MSNREIRNSSYVISKRETGNNERTVNLLCVCERETERNGERGGGGRRYIIKCSVKVKKHTGGKNVVPVSRHF